MNENTLLPGKVHSDHRTFSCGPSPYCLEPRIHPMATSNIAGRAQRDAIARTPFGSSFSRTALDKPQDSSYGDLQYRRSWATRCDRQNSLWVSILVHSS